MDPFHPELSSAAKRIPRFSFTPGLTRFIRFVQRLRGVRKPRSEPGLTIRDEFVAGPPDNPHLRVRLYYPAGTPATCPALLWMHGGGFLIGSPEDDEAELIRLSRELGLVVAAVQYRIGPSHPFPAALTDSFAALSWLHNTAKELGIAANRIAIGGRSAGAGLAAALAQFAYDEGTVPLAFQLLIYPMLDDRTTSRTDVDQTSLRFWNSRSNLFGWTAYLGRAPGGADVSDHAVPARRDRLEGLPPAWIGVGTCDLFHDENVEYAARLQKAGVPCTLKVVEGGYHAFDMGKEANVILEFQQSYTDAMRAILKKSTAT